MENPEDTASKTAEPTTKKELYKYFSGRGPNKMILSFLSDRSLQIAAIIIVEICEPIEEEYRRDLACMEGLFPEPVIQSGAQPSKCCFP